jgi:NADPH:quinone reductase-like Zn-dependent oxidoreductase
LFIALIGQKRWQKNLKNIILCLEMKAIILSGPNNIVLENVPQPEKAPAGHIIIEMYAAAINSGDKLFIAGAFPRGIPLSRYSIAGVSGAGKVIEWGEGVPNYYKGRNVTIYRSLRQSEETIGTWSELACMHYLNCAVLPENANPEFYSGSLVNIITPYAFLKQVEQEGHTAIICTAGNSATGVVMLGLCLMYDFPIISIVRTEKGKKELEAIGATNIIVQNEREYKQRLQQTAAQLNATVVFDGVGGSTLSNIIDILPFNTTIYSYGFLDKQTPFSFHTTSLMRGITIKGFSNFRTATVQDDSNLEKALRDISSIIHQPYFRTKISKHFSLEEANEAIGFSSPEGGKAVLDIRAGNYKQDV